MRKNKGSRELLLWIVGLTLIVVGIGGWVTNPVAASLIVLGAGVFVLARVLHRATGPLKIGPKGLEVTLIDIEKTPRGETEGKKLDGARSAPVRFPSLHVKGPTTVRAEKSVPLDLDIGDQLNLTFDLLYDDDLPPLRVAQLIEIVGE